MSGKLAIIVDDEWEMRELLKPICTKMGFDIAEASSGESYLKDFGETNEAVLILDMFMPHQSGLSLFDDLAARKPSVPLIIISGNGRMFIDGATAMAKDKGLNVIAAFTKPINFEKLEKALAEIPG